MMNKKIRFTILIIGSLAVVAMIYFKWNNHQILQEIKHLPVPEHYFSENELKHLKKIKRYFPSDSLSKDKELDRAKLYLFGKLLFTMREGPLWEKAKKSKNFVIRFLYIPTFENPVVMKIEIDNNKDANLLVKKTDGKGGFYSGAITEKKQVSLNQKDIETLLSLLENIDFWNIPILKEQYGVDETRWVLEGIKEGKYNVINTVFPKNDNLKQIEKFFLEKMS